MANTSVCRVLYRWACLGGGLTSVRDVLLRSNPPGLKHSQLLGVLAANSSQLSPLVELSLC